MGVRWGLGRGKVGRYGRIYFSILSKINFKKLFLSTSITSIVSYIFGGGGWGFGRFIF